MSLKSLAEYYQFKLQVKDQKISSLDVFSKIDNNVLFKDGSLLEFNDDESMQSKAPNQPIELSYNKGNDNLYACVKFDRNKEQLFDEITTRKLFLNFNEDKFYTKTYGENAEEISLTEAKEFIQTIGLDFHHLEKAFYQEDKKNNDLKNIILNCLNKDNDNVIPLKKNNRNKKRP